MALQRSKHHLVSWPKTPETANYEAGNRAAWIGHCGARASDGASILHAEAWDWLPPTAVCARCVRSVGPPYYFNPSYIVVIECALIGIARAFADH